MTLVGTVTQFQSVVALLPSVTRVMAYYMNETGVISAGLPEWDFKYDFTPRPSEATFIAAFPSAVLVGAVSQP